MTFKLPLIATTSVALGLCGAASAGGFSDEIIEVPVTMVEPAAPTGSIPGWVIPAAIAVALIALAASDDDDDDEGGSGTGSGVSVE